MGKKKKSQLKPVTRGFATTSVPSKKAIVEAESQAASQTSEADGSVDTPGSVSASSQPFEVKNASQDNIDLELQALVDKLQDKTEREIGRTLKALEVDRRMAKSYRLLDFPALWRNQILELIREEQKQQVSKSPLLGESEDKLLPRFGILYGVLRRLGLSQAHTMECLSANRRLDLEEALEWVYLATLEGQLVWEQAIPQPRQTSRPEYSHQSIVKMLPASTNISSGSLSTGDGRSVVVLSKTSQRDKISTTGRVQLTGTGDATDAGPVANTNAHSSDQEGDFSIEETDLNIVHATLRLQVLRIQKSGQLASQKERVAGLEKRIRDIEKDYLYSSRLANIAFTSGKAEMEAKLLQDRLRAGAEPGQLPTQPESHLPTEEVELSLPTLSSAENAPDDSGGEEDTDTMFGNLLDEMPKEEVLSNGVVVMVKDMATKHWNGKTARFLLADTIKRRDRYATIHYQVISGGSRAVRCECIIRWTGGKVDQWKMEKVACHDSNQAEDYVSTLALHDITYPLSVGFAGAPPSGIAPVNHRLLAPVFRDLWMELEGLRKSEEDSVNRQVWSDLRSIARDRIVIREAGNKLSRVPDSVQDRQPSYSASVSKATQEELIHLISSRQSTPAYQSMLKTRLSLPIAVYRHEILETLETHQILVLSGETGCGKSTQVPAFIMEDQLSRGKTCKVICTEPRRISAISLAQRVSAEMGEPGGAVGTNNSLIGYSIRLESNISKSTRLAFVTNGIALRMLEGNDDTGASIDEVTHIIVDEVHERSIESDFLLIILKSLLSQRPNLRVVLMSATLDAEKISKYFGDCPVISVPGRTFPVNVQFLEDAVEFAGYEITELSPYARRANDKFSRSKAAQLEWTENSVDILEAEDGAVMEPVQPIVLEKRYSRGTVSTVNLLDERLIPYDLIVRLLERLCFEDTAYSAYSAAILIFLPGINEIRKVHDMLLGHELFSSDLFRIYPLHSTISSEGQGAVFEVPPVGIRKIVISSNISETGITIPDVTAVIDSGKHRQMIFDEKRQLSRLLETFIAKSNAAQRRGRAGRVRDGLCFHLFTKLKHDTMMADHPVPEMLRLSLSDLALRTKIMKVNVGSSIEDILSRALDPPTQINIQRAVSSLVEVGALTSSEEITPLGIYLARLPTDVSLAKFLIMATIFKCLDPALTIAAALSSKSPFVTPFGKEDEAEKQKALFKVDNSDFLTIHNAFSTWRRACENGQTAARNLCRKSFLSYQNLQQIEEIRQQYLSYLIESSLIRVDGSYKKDLSRARFGQGRGRPRFILAPSEWDVNSTPGKHAIINGAIVAGLYPRILVVDSLNEGQQMRTLSNSQPAFFHPSSINFGKKPLDVSAGASCLTYFTLMHSKRLYVWETGPVDDLAMTLLCGDADIKLAAECIVLDRKIKFRLDAKDALIVKYLRERIQKLLQIKLRRSTSAASYDMEKWERFAMAIISRKAEDEAC